MKSTQKIFFLISCLLIFSMISPGGPLSLYAQLPGLSLQTDAGPSEDIITPEIFFSLDKAYRGGTVQIAVVGRIAPGWHVNSNQPAEEFLIPTAIVPDLTPGLKVEEIIYPPAVQRSFSFSETPLSVYEEQVIIGVLLGISSEHAGDSLVFSGVLGYQACNDVACLPPAETRFRGMLPLAGLDQPANLTHPDLFEQIDFGLSAKTEGNNSANNEINRLIERHGLAVSLLFIFLGGLALNLTPCVYPLIPITLSYFGGQTDKRTARVFSLAVVYVLGMALTYSVLGVLAASSGALFGAVLQSPPVLIFVAAVMLLLALSMFGLYEIQMPLFLTQLAGGSRPGYFGALFMGLTVGIVAAPCIGPFVLALLTYVATLGNPVVGFWMFFALALGLGVPFVLLGTFSGLLQNLPRAGMWMVWVKKVFGVVLLAMSAYFLQPILPELLKKFLLPAVLLAGGIYLGFVEASKFNSALFPWLKKVLAVAFVSVAAWLAWPEKTAHAEVWRAYDEVALLEAKQNGKPVIIDFTAEWCLACKELEKLTFSHAEVLGRADRFVFLRADLTRFGSPPVQEIRQRFQIKGLPTIVFLDANGNEVENLRVVGFVDGPQFAHRMERAGASGKLSE